MEARREERQDKARFRIEKLEDRIAPSAHCGVLAEVPANENAADGLATAMDATGCDGSDPGIEEA